MVRVVCFVVDDDDDDDDNGCLVFLTRSCGLALLLELLEILQFSKLSRSESSNSDDDNGVSLSAAGGGCEGSESLRLLN